MVPTYFATSWASSEPVEVARTTAITTVANRWSNGCFECRLISLSGSDRDWHRPMNTLSTRFGSTPSDRSVLSGQCRPRRASGSLAAVTTVINMTFDTIRPGPDRRPSKLRVRRPGSMTITTRGNRRHQDVGGSTTDGHVAMALATFHRTMTVVTESAVRHPAVGNLR